MMIGYNCSVPHIADLSNTASRVAGMADLMRASCALVLPTIRLRFITIQETVAPQRAQRKWWPEGCTVQSIVSCGAKLPSPLPQTGVDLIITVLRDADLDLGLGAIFQTGTSIDRVRNLSRPGVL